VLSKARFDKDQAMTTPFCQMARDLTRHILWSDQLMYDCLAGLPPEETTRQRPTLFRNMLHTMNHIRVINHIWQCHLIGVQHPYSARNTPDHPPLPELKALHLELDQWYVDWFDGLDEQGLGQAVEFVLIGGQRGHMSRMQILQHFAMHTHYHRGYVADMIYQVQGQRPPVMDLPVFYRETRPNP
jgi:uncharacterized damage-inducible protein DinB